jgi:hypothetical protein
MPRMPGVPFIRPRTWTSGRPGGPPRFIVIHYTAGSEGPTAAEDGVAYDQRRTDGTSAHFYVDRDSIIQCVDTNDRSHTALYYGNLWGIHIEQCGTVQTREQWLDPASRATIRNAAKVCAWAMQAHSLPLVRLVDSQIRTGKGIGGHKDVTIGFWEDGGTHRDPDGNLPGSYPYNVLFEDITAIMNGEEEMPIKDYVPVLAGMPDVSTQETIEVNQLLMITLREAARANAKAAAIQAELAGEPVITLTPEQLDQLGKEIAGSLVIDPGNPLTDADLDRIEGKVKEALREGTGI